MLQSLPVIQDLLSLALESSGAAAAEVHMVDGSGSATLSERAGTEGPIEATFDTVVQPLVIPSARDHPRPIAAWVGSAIAVPLSGPSAEAGWLAVAHPSPGHFSDSTVTGLSRLAGLVEHVLDRSLEQERFDEVGVDLRRHQEELRRARDQLELSNRELEQFAYIAAHELVAPLRAVAIYAEVLTTVTEAAPNSPTQALDCAVQIREGVDRMTEQVQLLLALSSNHQDVAMAEVVSVAEAVHAAIDTLAVPLDEVGAQVTVGELPAIRARLVPLQSVFANLLTNAIRYRHPDRQLQIRIESSENAGGVRVEVADNGQGIASEDQTRVFGMFERASSTEDGGGIGLALSRRILDLFGAEIGVATNVAGGATVWIDFPHLD